MLSQRLNPCRPGGRAWIVILLFLVYNALLALNANAFRLSFRRIIEVSQPERFQHPPDDPNQTFRFEDPRIVSGFSFPIPGHISAQPATRAKAVALLMHFGEINSRARVKGRSLPEGPATM